MLQGLQQRFFLAKSKPKAKTEEDDWSDVESDDKPKGFTDENASWLKPVQKKKIVFPYKPPSDSEESESEDDSDDERDEVDDSPDEDKDSEDEDLNNLQDDFGMESYSEAESSDDAGDDDDELPVEKAARKEQKKKEKEK